VNSWAGGLCCRGTAPRTGLQLEQHNGRRIKSSAFLVDITTRVTVDSALLDWKKK